LISTGDNERYYKTYSTVNENVVSGYSTIVYEFSHFSSYSKEDF